MLTSNPNPFQSKTHSLSQLQQRSSTDHSVPVSGCGRTAAKWMDCRSMLLELFHLNSHLSSFLPPDLCRHDCSRWLQCASQLSLDRFCLLGAGSRRMREPCSSIPEHGLRTAHKSMAWVGSGYQFEINYDYNSLI